MQKSTNVHFHKARKIVQPSLSRLENKLVFILKTTFCSNNVTPASSSNSPISALNLQYYKIFMWTTGSYDNKINGLPKTVPNAPDPGLLLV